MDKILNGINEQASDEAMTYLGGELFVKVEDYYPDFAYLYSGLDKRLIKKAKLSDKIEKKLFVVEAIALGAKQVALANALKMSRQTIHNYLECRKHFGLEGLINGYQISEGKSLRKQRELRSPKKTCGNMAEKLSEIRQCERDEADAKQIRFCFQFETNNESLEHTVENCRQPFAEEHSWVESRYAGIFSYIIVLMAKWKWLRMLTGLFGTGYRIFMVFLLMAGLNIRSIEQLKNIRAREAGVILGLKRIPSKPKVWEWFYNAADKKNSLKLLSEYFRHQLITGLVGSWLWFTDGHLLPYTGKFKLHYSYSTQRRMPFAGQTNFVSTDDNGNIVDFEIQEGKGNMRSRILSLAEKWRQDVPLMPAMVFDREGYDAKFFSALISQKVPFVTWEKYTKKEMLNSIDEERFENKLTFNGTEYRFFETEKSYQLKTEAKESEGVKEPKDSTKTQSPDTNSATTPAPSDDATPVGHFSLRHFFIQNMSNNHRACGLAWTGDIEGKYSKCYMTAENCIEAILKRWGASENTFKHLGSRHPFHYQPGFKLKKSENQEIANPELKKKAALIKKVSAELKKLYKKLAKSKVAKTKAGKPHERGARERLETSIAEEEEKLARIREEKKQLPKRVDISTLENYKSFKRIDNEGKNLFDFVTASVWNARKTMVDWLKPSFSEENEVVDLFYAITYCQGWVKNTEKEVVVRLEPLEQRKRRSAQEKLCRTLTHLNARTPMGKRLRIEVGETPLKKKKCPKKDAK